MFHLHPSLHPALLLLLCTPSLKAYLFTHFSPSKLLPYCRIIYLCFTQSVDNLWMITHLTISILWWTLRRFLNRCSGFKVNDGKYNKPRILFMRFNTCVYFLSSLCFLPIHSSFHLRGKKPLKWTPTNMIHNNNNKALSCGTTHLRFHKCDKSNGATLFPANKSNQTSGLVYSGSVCLRKRFPTPIWPASLRTGIGSKM